MPDWDQIRAQYPALENWTYLNTATFGQLSLASQQAVSRHFAHRDELACSDFLGWFDDMDQVRQSVASLVHCSPNDVAFVTNAASALSILLGGLEWKPGDRVVVLENEFPNNIYHPAMLRGAGVEFVETPWERFYEAIKPSTRLVLLSALNYTNGFRPPLAEISRFLHERGVLLYVDGTQGLGAIEINLEDVQIDMLAAHAYKWLLSPNGAAFMCIRPELRRLLEPNVIGWRSHHDWRSVDNLHHGAPTFSPAAERYEGGMLNFTALYAMEEAIRQMLEIGPAVIERRVLDLAGETRKILESHGAEIAHANSPIIAARWKSVDVSALARELAAKRILVSARHGHLRVSVHLYNNESDIAKLSDGLTALLD